MRVSANELRSATVKAFRGAGFAVGVAQDIGRATEWLEKRALPGATAAIAALESHAANDEAPRASCVTADAHGQQAWRCKSTAAAIDGPAALDLLCCSLALSVTMSDPDAPLLVAGLTGVAAADTGRSLVFRSLPDPDGSDSKAASWIFSPDGVIGDLKHLANLTGPIHLSVTQEQADFPVAAVPQRAEGGFDIPDAVWQRIYEFAAMLWVPATEASRHSGAGAGLTDND